MNTIKISDPTIAISFRGTPTFSLSKKVTITDMLMAATTEITPLIVRILFRSEGLSVNVVTMDCMGTSVNVQVKS